MPYKFYGDHGKVRIPSPSGRGNILWPLDHTGEKFVATCHYCGKKVKGVTTFRFGYQCRGTGQTKWIGRITPVVVSKKLGVHPDPKLWDFVCSDCEPARKKDWCNQQGFEPRGVK